MKKVWHVSLIVLVVGVVVVSVVGVFLFAKSCGLITTKPVMERSLPDNAGMLYEIKTPSRVYLAETVVTTEEKVMITGYWAFNGGKWQYREGTKVLFYRSYGVIEVKPPLAPPQ